MKKFTIGIDVGGTNIKLGIVNQKGEIISRSRLNTKSISHSKTKLINALVETINELVKRNKLHKKQILGMGIGLPGLINPKDGIVVSLPNIPGWNNVRLKSLLQKKTGFKVFIDNDVNVITLAEWKYGVGKGCENLVCITIGTGVGGGLILDNRLYRGERFAAGEVGHMPLDQKGRPCTCGGHGCLETYVGNARLLDRAAKIFNKKGIRLQDIHPLAKAKNPKALKFWKEAGTYLGNGLVGVTNLLNPKLIIIGGGVSNNYSFFAPTIKEVLKRRCMKVQGATVRVVKATFGDSAGIIGAQVLVKDSLSAKK